MVILVTLVEHHRLPAPPSPQAAARSRPVSSCTLNGSGATTRPGNAQPPRTFAGVAFGRLPRLVAPAMPEAHSTDLGRKTP
jgi:hypothetical protein